MVFNSYGEKSYFVRDFTKVYLSQNVTVWDIVKRSRLARHMPDVVGGSNMTLPAIY